MLMNKTPLTARELREMQPVVLAYIGDAVYELLSRCYVIQSGPQKIRAIHTHTVELVHARHQAEALQGILEELTEEEADVVRRGRNVKSHVPRHADPRDYRFSTGLESLFGYLYLSGQDDRLEELFARMQQRPNAET